MKSILAIGVVLALAVSASASIVLQDDFSTNANLTATTPDVGGQWAAHSGAGATPIVASGGAITLAQGSGSREDDNASFAGGVVAGAGSKFYAAFDLAVTGGSNTGYFAHFSDGGTAKFAARLGVTAGSGSDYALGLFSGSTSVAATYPVGGTFGTTYRVVTAYDYDSGTCQLWINPIAGLDEAAAGQVAAVSATPTNDKNTAISAYAFRQASGNSTETIDNLVVGTAWTDVVPAPEPTTVLLLCIGSLGLLRRRG